MSTSLLRIVLLALPVLLTFSCLFVFQLAANKFGLKWGYLTGFLFYWVVWCMIVPILLIGPDAIFNFFKVSFVFDYKIILCLAALLIFVYAYAFPKAVKQATPL